MPELDVATGYTAWAPIYDTMENGLIAAEEPLVDSVTRELPIGRALDAACGTGRHASRLAAAATRPTASTPRPRCSMSHCDRVPGAEFRLGDLTALPVDDAGFDFAICALTLAHLRDPAPAIAELAPRSGPAGGSCSPTPTRRS